MSLLEVMDLTHAFGDKELYRHAELSLYKGEHMGIVGQNGSGKSTLLNILLGEVVPSGGRITWQRGARLGHLDQYAEVDGSLTIDEYLRGAFAALLHTEQKLAALYETMDTKTPPAVLAQAARWQETLMANDFYAIDERIGRVAAGLGLVAIGMRRRLQTLSGGQRAKAILAKLLLARPDVLLLDEPTNFLDAEHIAWLSEYLRGFEGGFMIVSHNFDFLDRITTCICDIEFQTIRKYHGRYASFLQQKEHQREEYARQYQAQQKEVRKLEDYIARNKARAATARMAKSRQKQLDRIDRLAPAGTHGKPDIAFAARPLTASRALELRGLRVGYDRPLLPRLNLEVAGGQKVVIAGFNGIGKSTLLKTLMGELAPLDGGFRFAPEVIPGYLPQDMAWPQPELSPLQIIAEAHPAIPHKQIRRELARFGMRAEHVVRPIQTLSGGEQSRVKLCRLALGPCNFLILDEPTNHLDAETKQALQAAIEVFEGSVILVCHEAPFYSGFIDRVINIEQWLRK